MDTNTKETCLWQGNYGDLKLPLAAVEDIAQQGRNDDAVGHWERLINWEGLPMAAVWNEVNQHDIYPSDDLAARRYLLWIAAWDMREDGVLD